MSDLINRADAVKAIKGLYKAFDFEDVDAYENAKEECDIYALGLLDAISAVTDAPTVIESEGE